MHTEHTDPDLAPVTPAPLWRRIGRLLLEWGLTIAAAIGLWLLVGALRAPDLPAAAPDFSLSDLQGQTTTLSAHQGQTVVLNFWATWCGPCRVEIPAFSRFAEANPEVEVWGIAVDGSATELRRAVQQFGIRYPVLRADESVQQNYGVETLPTTVVVGPDGTVRAAHVGIMPRPQLWWLTR